MTDTSKEAAERIIESLSQKTISGPPTTGRKVPINPSGEKATTLIRALAAERDRWERLCQKSWDEESRLLARVLRAEAKCDQLEAEAEGAAAIIAAERAEVLRLKKLLAEKTLDSLAAEGQAFDAHEEQKEPFSEYGHYGENNPPVGMSSPGDKDYEV